MNDEQNTLTRLICDLTVAWKSFFGLYTQYVGYLSASMIKTLLVIKRFSYYDIECNYSNLNLRKLNEKALEYGVAELPYKDEKEINAVLPVLWNHIEKYDLSDETISDESWNELIQYLDSKIAKE